jgi:hypothetical protein
MGKGGGEVLVTAANRTWHGLPATTLVAKGWHGQSRGRGKVMRGNGFMRWSGTGERVGSAFKSTGDGVRRAVELSEVTGAQW